MSSFHVKLKVGCALVNCMIYFSGSEISIGQGWPSYQKGVNMTKLELATNYAIGLAVNRIEYIWGGG